MISLQKEKEKDDKQLEEVSWHGFVVVLVVLYHSLVRELIIFAEKLIFLSYWNFFCFYPGSTQDLTTANWDRCKFMDVRFFLCKVLNDTWDDAKFVVSIGS